MRQQETPKEVISVDNASRLLLESMRDMFRGFIDHLPNISLAVVVLLLTWAISWSVQKVYWRFMTKRRLRKSLKDLIIKLITIVVWILGMMASSIVLFPSIEPESVLAGLGLSSIAIGFAFKDIIENFFAGFLIMVREPMEIGDVVECEGVEGRVEEISIRDTMLRQTDGQRVLVPNALMFKNPVRIRTDKSIRRTTIACGVSYDADLQGAKELIMNALSQCESVRQDPEPQVFANEFADSSINFEVTWWTGSEPVDVRRSRDEVVIKVKSALDSGQVEIPFPQRVLHMQTESEQSEADANGTDKQDIEA